MCGSAERLERGRAHALAEQVEVGVRVGRQHRGEHRSRRGHRERVAVERADLLVAAVDDGLHHLRRATDRPARHAAAERLGEAHDVGLHAEQGGDAPGTDAEPGLHLVERQQHAVLAREPAHALEVARLGHDDAGVHHHRLHDHAGHPSLVGVEHGGEHIEVVERNDGHELGHRLGDASAGEHRVRAFTRAELVEFVVVAHHHRVVMAVVAALDLHDQVASGGGPHQVDRVHGRLGARVAEAPQRQSEARGEQLGDDDGVLGGLGEVGASPDPLAHRGDDRGVAVSGEHRAVAGVQVDVLGAVDVVHLGALSVAQPHRGRTGDLPARRGPPGQRPRRPRRAVERSRLAGSESPLLVADQVVDRAEPATCGASSTSGRSQRWHGTSAFRVD